MSDKISALAPTSFPELPAVGGVTTATFAAGLKYVERADLMLAVVPEGSTLAGVLTTSLCPSAPVEWCRQVIERGTARAIVCNAGNANAFTGTAGETSAALTAGVVAKALGVTPDDICLASTGVIGENLPDDRLAAGLMELGERLQTSNAESWHEAADAIRTTDTFAKGSGAPVSVEGLDGSVVGIAKGSGMIEPAMATMLSFLFTDLAVDAAFLQTVLSQAVDHTFNRITVDSDTSTSDTVLLFATGSVGNAAISSLDDPGASEFVAAVEQVTLDLAHQIVRDGEGASKFVSVNVTGAESDEAATTIAKSIANSPLVKTALAAEDANWGRIVMAVGKAGERADRDALQISIGPELVAERGVVADGYDEARATRHLQQDDVMITVDVGIGTGRSTVWTCDLTHGYIDINAGYRS